jgi:hypothetical protein
MKWTNALGTIACLLVIAGAVLAVMHIDGAKTMGAAGLALFFLYLGARSLEQKRSAAD